jgi:FKBP-type peptidyl-prolyl cis-trans isomerase
MSFRLILATAAVLFASHVEAQVRSTTTAAATGTGATGELKTLRQKASYAFGMTMGRQLKKDATEVDVELLIQGIRDAVGSGKVLLNDDQAMQAMQAFEKAVTEKHVQENQKFLTDNKTRQGVKETESGLQYKILKAGTGPKPKLSDKVKVVYRGTFVNGEEFDTSGGKPFSIGVDNVILGWKEALQIMPVGSKWQLFVPAELAYGAQGFPPAIGPNATLIFDIELVGIEKPGAAPPANSAVPSGTPRR